MGESTTSGTTTSDYGRRKKQVGKPEMYMMTALWMEYSPWAPTKDPENLKDIDNVVGSVFVLPNDRVLSADCSRVLKEGIVHGAVQALIKYPDQAKGCTVYLSRKPCANCVKLLVQAAVAKVYYLPLKPEKESDKEGNKSVDALFRVSPVSQSIFIPNITQEDIDELEKSKNDYGKTSVNKSVKKIKEELRWNGKWKENIEQHLSWEEFADKGIKNQTETNMEKFFEWFYTATWCTGGGCTDDNEEMDFTKVACGKPPDKEFSSRLASHLSRLAQMLSNRTDDPNRGVGCVIESDDEIISIGWNGFPSKALYGNHPRGSYKDSEVQQKYPHVIHAEQNALLSRNRRDIGDTTVYVNKIPCDECMPMLYQLGVKTVVLPADKREEKEKKTVFDNLLKEITVYTHKIPE